MAQEGALLNHDSVSCSICLDLLKDPTTIPCGHSYCMSCIKTFWDGEDQRRIYSCPQCRQSFIPRPVLMKNIMLAELVEKLKKTGLGAAPADHCYGGPEDVSCDVCSVTAERAEKQKEIQVRRRQIQQRIHKREKDVELLQQKVEDINVSADKTVEDSEEIFTQLIHLIQERRSDVKQQVRSQQETEVSRVKELQEKLEQEITELKRKDAELEQLSHTEDHKQFLHNYPSVSALSGSPHSASIKIRPLKHFEDVRAAVSELRDKLQDMLRDRGTNVSLRGTAVGCGLLSESEPKTRADLLKYSREITLDPNSAHCFVLLSDGNRKATRMNQDQVYPDHPDRFTYYKQVLSRESLTGRCYWEVEWSGRVVVAVSYKDISRDEDFFQSVFGNNEMSWALRCDTHRYTYWDGFKTPLRGPICTRIGVYVDHRAGIVCFYSISKTTTLLFRDQTTFTQPLHAGVRLFDPGSTAEFIKVQKNNRADADSAMILY